MDEIEKRARELAIAAGHKRADAEIVCVGGVRQSVWKFYQKDAIQAMPAK
jgi:hypothetical protein